MNRRLLYFTFAFLLYLLLVGTFDFAEIAAGIANSLLTVLLFSVYFEYEARRFLDLRRWFWLIAYIPFFAWECLKANLDVAFRVLHPERPINPGIVKIRTELKSDIARTFLANSITLTPGTMSVEIDGEYLYIHWIDVKEKDLERASCEIAQKFEKYLKRIFE